MYTNTIKNPINATSQASSSPAISLNKTPSQSPLHPIGLPPWKRRLSVSSPEVPQERRRRRRRRHPGKREP